MYHGSGGFGGPGAMYMVAGERSRHYPLEAVPAAAAGRGASSPAHAATPRRWQQRRDRHHKTDSTAFGYDSDDSSLSSNASGSNKSGEKGKCTLLHSDQL